MFVYTFHSCCNHFKAPFRERQQFLAFSGMSVTGFKTDKKKNTIRQVDFGFIYFVASLFSAYRYVKVVYIYSERLLGVNVS